MRRSTMNCGEEAKPLTLLVDEYKMVRPEMYSDLECLIKNHIISEVVRKPDVVQALTSIFQQQDAEQKTEQVASADTYADDDLTAEQ